MRWRSNESLVIVTIFVLLLLCYALQRNTSKDPVDGWDGQPDQQFEIAILQRELDALARTGFMHAELYENYTAPDHNQTIHIVLIVADNPNPTNPGISVVERVETLLKSILTFYGGELHVHLLTNTRSGDILSTLFRTWPLARVRTSFYNVEADQRSLEWVKSTHEVSGYGQLKYVIPEILAEYVEKAIFIDTDMLVLEDLSILHSYFTVMEERGTFLAATTDQYRRRDLEEAFGKGAAAHSLNSGLVLYNMRAMRAGNWSSLWRETGVWLMNKLGNLKCPQDLLAAIAIMNPHIYLRLPCVYNFQIGVHSRSEKCLKSKADLLNVKIPHWTGKLKYYESSGYTKVFSPIYRCFQKMDGYEFEEGSGDSKYRTLTNVRNTKRTIKKEDVTLVAHVDYKEAIDVMRRLNAAWLGPISLVVCGSSWERAQLLAFLFSNPLHDSFNVHFVYQQNGSCPLYHLRQTAVNESLTNTVLLTDSISSIEVDTELRETCEKAPIVLRNNKTWAGILLEKGLAQRLTAQSWNLEEGISALKLRHTTIQVKPAARNFIEREVNKWKLREPSDAFCLREIEKRRRNVEIEV